MRAACVSVDAITPLTQISLSPVFTPASSAGPSTTVFTVYRPFGPVGPRWSVPTRILWY